MDQYTLVLNPQKLTILLEIFHSYLESFADSEDSDNHQEKKFIREFVGMLMPKCLHFDPGESFEESALKRRIAHIEWLFGSDNDDGLPEFKLPTTYHEMKALLLNYDMHWLGHRDEGDDADDE